MLRSNMSEESGNYKTSISTEDGRNYNVRWNQEGKIVSSNIILPIERWPFKLDEETEEEFKERMNKLISK